MQSGKQKKLCDALKNGEANRVELSIDFYKGSIKVFINGKDYGFVVQNDKALKTETFYATVTC